MYKNFLIQGETMSVRFTKLQKITKGLDYLV